MDEPKGLRLTPKFRQRMEAKDRLRLQPPTSEAERKDWDRKIGALPGDVLLSLEALRLLADQGNEVAKVLFEAECKRLGLWYTPKVITVTR